MSFPFIYMLPEVGSTSFKSIFISVDLPHPLGPTIKANSPFSICKVVCFTASVPV